MGPFFSSFEFKKVNLLFSDTAISHNADCANIKIEFTERTGLLSREIQQIKQEKRTEVGFKIQIVRLEDVLFLTGIIVSPMQTIRV